MKKFWANIKTSSDENTSIAVAIILLAAIIFVLGVVPLIMYYPIPMVVALVLALLSRIVYAGITGK